MADITKRTNWSQSLVRRLKVGAPQQRLFDGIATLAGLRGWWTTAVSGSPKPSKELRFDFEGVHEHIIMRVEEIERSSTVRWHCVVHTSLEEWKDTKIVFQISALDKHACELVFKHVGLNPTLTCYGDCKAGWDYFLASLVAHAEHGQGTPFGAALRAKRQTGEIKPKVRTTHAAKPESDRRFQELLTKFAADVATPQAGAKATDQPAKRGRFGANALKVGGKMFAMLSKGQLVVKLPKERAALLVDSGRGKYFDPGHGRLMKEWVVITDKGLSWSEVASEARDFVSRGERIQYGQ